MLLPPPVKQTYQTGLTGSTWDVGNSHTIALTAKQHAMR